MFLRSCIVSIFLCIIMGAASQSAGATTPEPMKDLLSVFRWTYQRPVVKNKEQTDGASAVYHRRRARDYAERNDIDKACTHFGLALTNAMPGQIPGIAVEYAAFLSAHGDLHRAEIVLRQALLQKPEDRDITQMLAKCLVRQNKLVEGLRYFKSVYTLEEAQIEIAAIYREQGNTDMLAVVEKRWGQTGSEQQGAAVIAAADSAPSPLFKPRVLDTRAFDNGIPLPDYSSQAAAIPMLPRGIEAYKLATPPQPRQHYTSNRTEGLDGLFNIQPVAASMPVQ